MSGSSNVLDAIAHPAQLNVLGAYQGAAQTAGTIYDLKGKQADQAWGEALQQATDENGNVDYPKANAIAAHNPMATQGMLRALTATSRLTGEQQENIKGNMTTVAHHALTIQLDPSDENVNAVADDLKSRGMPEAQAEGIRSRLLSMRLPDGSPDLAQRQQLASRAGLAAMDAVSAANRAGGEMKPEQFGGATAPTVQTQPVPGYMGGGLIVGPMVPHVPPPGLTVEWTGKDQVPHKGTWEEFQAADRAGQTSGDAPRITQGTTTPPASSNAGTPNAPNAPSPQAPPRMTPKASTPPPPAPAQPPPPASSSPQGTPAQWFQNRFGTPETSAFAPGPQSALAPPVTPAPAASANLLTPPGSAAPGVQVASANPAFAPAVGPARPPSPAVAGDVSAMLRGVNAAQAPPGITPAAYMPPRPPTLTMSPGYAPPSPRPGGVQGPNPDDVVKWDQSRALYAADNANSANYVPRMFPLTQALHILETNPDVKTGAGADALNQVKSFLQTALPRSRDEITSVKSFDELGKYFNQVLMNNPAAGRSDMMLGTALGGSPNTHLNTLANIDVAKGMTALERMKQAALLDFKTQGGQPRDWTDYLANYQTSHDPRAFVMDMLSPELRDKVFASMDGNSPAKVRERQNYAATIALIKQHPELLTSTPMP